MQTLRFYTYSTCENVARVASYLIATGRAFTFDGKFIKFIAWENTFQDMLDTDHSIKGYAFKKVYYYTVNT